MVLTCCGKVDIKLYSDLGRSTKVVGNRSNPRQTSTFIDDDDDDDDDDGGGGDAAAAAAAAGGGGGGGGGGGVVVVGQKSAQRVQTIV